MNHLLEEWGLSRKWLVPALDGNTELEVIEMVLAGRAQLWRGERSALVTQLVNREARTVHVLLGGGDRRELLGMVAGIAAWARVMGAQFATVNGRKGWARALAPFGFAPRGVELWKDLKASS